MKPETKKELVTITLERNFLLNHISFILDHLPTRQGIVPYQVFTQALAAADGKQGHLPLLEGTPKKNKSTPKEE